MKNLELVPLQLSSWRKMALGTWRRAGDPSVYSRIEIHARAIVERQKLWPAARGRRAPSLTVIFTRAISLTLRRHTQLNGMIRWGRIYNRKDVNVFLQTAVDRAGHELSGFVIERADEKTLEQISAEVAEKAAAIHEGRDLNVRKTRSTLRWIPAFAMGWALDLVSFLMYGLNLDLRRLGFPKDPFGSLMITSIGSLGLEEAFVPLVPYSRVPLLIALGAVRERAVVRDGQVRVEPIFKMCVTFDHRFMDGVLGAKMAKHLRRLLETEKGLDELGL